MAIEPKKTKYPDRRKPLPHKKPGPKPGSLKMPEQRQKIQASQLVNRLQQYVHGDVLLEPAQVTAAVALLKKVMPDLSTQKLVGDSTRPLVIVTRAE